MSRFVHLVSDEDMNDIPRPGDLLRIVRRTVEPYKGGTDPTYKYKVRFEYQWEHVEPDLPPGAIRGLPVNWPSPSTNTPNVDKHPLEHYWSDREPLDAPWSDENGDEIERGDVTLP